MVQTGKYASCRCDEVVVWHRTYTFTCNSSTTIGYALYGSSTWNTGSTNGACQGAYQATAASGSRVGVMVFTNAGTVLRGKVIQSIVFSITCSGAGSSSSSKVLTFKQANYQAPASGLKGSDMVGTTLGTLTGKFYSNTTTHTLNASSNASLFRNMAAYFAAGNQTLVLHNGETSTSSGYSHQLCPRHVHHHHRHPMWRLRSGTTTMGRGCSARCITATLGLGCR